MMGAQNDFGMPELTIEQKQSKVEAFKADLIALREKYGFGKHESPDYNGAEEYCGSEFYFTFAEDEHEEPYYLETVGDIFKDVFGEF